MSQAHAARSMRRPDPVAQLTAGIPSPRERPCRRRPEQSGRRSSGCAGSQDIEGCNRSVPLGWGKQVVMKDASRTHSPATCGCATTVAMQPRLHACVRRHRAGCGCHTPRPLTIRGSEICLQEPPHDELVMPP